MVVAAVVLVALPSAFPEMSLAFIPLESVFGSIDSRAFQNFFFWLSADLESPPTFPSVSFPSLKFPRPKPNESSLALEDGEDEDGGVCFCFGGR